MIAPERITVVFVLHALAGGGAERVAVRLLQHLDRKRFRPMLALFRVEGPYLDEVPSDVTIYDLKKRRKASWPGAVRRLVKFLRRENAQVVLAFDWHANIAAIAASRLARRNVRVIAGVRIHESTYISLLSPTVRPIRRATIRTVYPLADMVVANSEVATQNLAQKFKLSPEKLLTIHNPVDVAAIEKLAAVPMNGTWFHQECLVILGAGRLVAQKGFEILIDAIAQVRQVHDCKLVILGDGPEETTLRARATARGIGEHVVFAGFQSNPFNWMRHADVFVLSSYAEGFPNVLLEAMACGTPVVATRCLTGPEEILMDGREGLLVPPGNAAAMAEAITKLLNSPSRRTAMGAAGHERVQDFSVTRIVGAFEDLFLQVMNAKPAEASSLM